MQIAALNNSWSGWTMYHYRTSHDDEGIGGWCSPWRSSLNAETGPRLVSKWCHWEKYCFIQWRLSPNTRHVWQPTLVATVPLVGFKWCAFWGEHEVYLISAYFKVQSNVTSRTAPVSRKAGSLLAMTDYVIILRCGMVYEFNEYIDIGCRVKASLLITLRWFISACNQRRVFLASGFTQRSHLNEEEFVNFILAMLIAVMMMYRSSRVR